VQQSTSGPCSVDHPPARSPLDAGPDSAFGPRDDDHLGLVHLVAPNAKIPSAQACSSTRPNGLFFSNIVCRSSYLTPRSAPRPKSFNMSFDPAPPFPSPLRSLRRAAYANNPASFLSRCWKRNHDSAALFIPPSLENSYVRPPCPRPRIGQAAFLPNYGATDVWIAAPAENIIITFPPAGVHMECPAPRLVSPIVPLAPVFS